MKHQLSFDHVTAVGLVKHHAGVSDKNKLIEDKFKTTNVVAVDGLLEAIHDVMDYMEVWAWEL